MDISNKRAKMDISNNKGSQRTWSRRGDGLQRELLPGDHWGEEFLQPWVVAILRGRGPNTRPVGQTRGGAELVLGQGLRDKRKNRIP